ncbi:hypothetical protein [Acidisoma sp. C75]
MNARPRAGNILRGVILLCRGDARGLSDIGAVPDAFLASLAPLIAFPLVGCGLMVAQGMVREGLTDFLASIIAILAPPLIAYSIARPWGKTAGWLRFATAFNWCQWVLPILGVLLVVIGSLFVQFGLPMKPTVLGLCALLLAYAFWLHWFLARHALGLARGRALLLVVVMNVSTLILVGGPQLAQMLVAGGQAAGGG